MCTKHECVGLYVNHTFIKLIYKKRNTNVSGRIFKIFPLTRKKGRGQGIESVCNTINLKTPGVPIETRDYFSKQMLLRILSFFKL